MDKSNAYVVSLTCHSLPLSIIIVHCSSLPHSITTLHHYHTPFFENGKWIDHKWSVQHREKIVKGDESVANMKPNVLYYPEDQFFPGVDFIFVKNSQADEKVKQAFAIQVTSSDTHKKKRQCTSHFISGLK